MGKLSNPLIEIVISKISEVVAAKSKIWPVILVGSVN